MNKRKLYIYNEENDASQTKKVKEPDNLKKNSLDSDEEDGPDEADYMLNEDDIEGEEDGVAGNYGEVRTTAFNMREELEEGHFDLDGHYIWNKNSEIKDNWLDNIDWEVIKPRAQNDKVHKGLGEDTDSEDEPLKGFEELACYKDILKYLEPKETIINALQRLGGKKKLSTVERIKLKKAGLLNDSEQVIKLTELVNNLLNQTGNMDIYQETFEKISKMIDDTEKPRKINKSEELDMYSEDFDDKEQKKLDVSIPGTSKVKGMKRNDPPLMWEFKWTEKDEDVEGPNTTEQMQKWVDDGYFKKGVWVRRCGQDQFFSSSRPVSDDSE